MIQRYQYRWWRWWFRIIKNINIYIYFTKSQLVLVYGLPGWYRIMNMLILIMDIEPMMLIMDIELMVILYQVLFQCSNMYFLSWSGDHTSMISTTLRIPLVRVGSFTVTTFLVTYQYLVDMLRSSLENVATHCQTTRYDTFWDSFTWPLAVFSYFWFWSTCQSRQV